MSRSWRTASVFISSTFRDMHAERDWLVRVVFPSIRERLLPHRIHLDDIDLRWGVTQEQAERDAALDLCLDQIDRARPFFVGILGQRYGYVPASFSPEAASKYGLVQHNTGKSITELEILYGVLANRPMHIRAMFFFRDPGFLAEVPEALRAVLVDDEQNAENARAKLARLKQAICDAKLPIPPTSYACRFAGVRVRWPLADDAGSTASAAWATAQERLIGPEEYRSLDTHLRARIDREGVVYLDGLQEFGEAVEQQLWKAIHDEFELPDTQSPPRPLDWDELAEELDAHQRFIESRLRIYVGREQVQGELARYADGADRVPCLVCGDPGVGKSAALARFATDYAEHCPTARVIPHFIGASPASSSLRALLRRFCLVLQRDLDLGEVPQTTEELISTLREFLTRIPPGRRVVLVIDALNQLDESDRTKAISWLPAELPEGVKVIVSCGSEPPAGEAVLWAFDRRPHRRVLIGGLTDEERREIVRRVPSLCAKTLNAKQVGLLLDNPSTENPLFLLVALEELRGFRSYEQLDARIRAFPRGADPVLAIFIQVIERLESDFGEQPTRDVLTLLAGARRGLSERELRELLAPEPGADSFFPLLRQLRAYLLYRSELLSYYHLDLQRALAARYLLTDDSWATVHARLARYFLAQADFLESAEEQRARALRLPATFRPSNGRKVDELPWHLLRAAWYGGPTAVSEAWDHAVDLLTEGRFLEAKAEAGMVFDLIEDFAELLAVLPGDAPRRPVVALLEEVIRRDAQFIARHPTTLFQCLWNTGWWYDCPEAASHYLPSTLGQPQPWDQQGPKLHALLERWRAAKESDTPGFLWARSLRPPSMALDSSQRAVFAGHTAAVRDLTVAPDGRQLLSASSDATLRVWDVSSQAEVACLEGHRGPVRCARFSGDGQRVVSWSDDYTVRAWEIGSRTELLRCGGGALVASLDFAPEAAKVAMIVGDGSVRVWNLARGEVEVERSGFAGTAHDVRFSPDGRVVALAVGTGIHLWDLAAGTVAVLEGHDREVTCLAFSADATRLASGSADRTVRVWSVPQRRQIQCWKGHRSGVSSIAYSDAEYVVSGGVGEVWLWEEGYDSSLYDFEDGDEALTAIAFAHVAGHQGLITGSVSGTLRIYDLLRMACLGDAQPFSAAVRSLAVSGDGQQFLAGSTDGCWGIWDSDGRHRYRMTADRSILRVAWSGNQRRVWLGLANAYAESWDAGKCMQSGDSTREMNAHNLHVSARFGALDLDPPRPSTFGLHEQSFTSIVLSPTGEHFVTGTGGATLRAWDADNGRLLAYLDAGATPIAVTISSDGQVFAAALDDGRISLWQSGTWRFLRQLMGDPGPWIRLTLSGDGRHLACEAKERPACLWDTAQGNLVTGLSDVDSLHQFVFSPDGSSLAALLDAGQVRVRGVAAADQAVDLKTGEAVDGLRWLDDHRLLTWAGGLARVWDVARREVTATFGAGPTSITAVTVLPDRNRVVLVAEDRLLRLWDVSRSRALPLLPEHAKEIRSLAVSGDGARVASGTGNGIVGLWDGRSAKKLADLPSGDSAVLSLTFSADGSRLASGSRDWKVRVWDVASGVEQWTLPGHNGTVLSVAFSLDGARLASGPGSWESTIRLWDLSTGETIAYLKGHHGEVLTLAVSDHGKFLASAGDDETVRIWDFATGGRLLELPVPGICVDALTFSPQGLLLVHVSEPRRQAIQVWDLDSSQLLRTIERPGWVQAITLDASRVARSSPLEWAIQRTESGEDLVWLPLTPEEVAADRTGTIWAASVGERLHLWAIEGRPR